MSATEKIEILLSKSKMTKLLFGSILFVALGFWFVLRPPKVENSLFGNPTLILISGILSILFFGLVAFSISKKLNDKKPGLIVDNTGITDNASGISAGHIPWNEIEEIKVLQVMKQKFLMILVNNPNDYIRRQRNMLKRKGAEMNYKLYGSPISISANTLKCDFEKLRNILQTQLDNSKI